MAITPAAVGEGARSGKFNEDEKDEVDRHALQSDTASFHFPRLKANLLPPPLADGLLAFHSLATTHRPDSTPERPSADLVLTMLRGIIRSSSHRTDGGWGRPAPSREPRSARQLEEPPRAPPSSSPSERAAAVPTTPTWAFMNPFCTPCPDYGRLPAACVGTQYPWGAYEHTVVEMFAEEATGALQLEPVRALSPTPSEAASRPRQLRSEPRAAAPPRGFACDALEDVALQVESDEEEAVGLPSCGQVAGKHAVIRAGDAQPRVLRRC
ncbi:hypothetical protein AB1Y20_006359 [Prymnesium parvum]|uniref:Uncharacterized protein n=1 Tax=Prymnesium parvum TaxID=97485 RepID=A0AB34J4J2_PRYPA